MDISLEHLAQLARLDLGERERDLFAGQLKDILVYMEKLGELDTTDVEPTSHVISLGNVFREDLPEPSLDREEALDNAPDRTEKFYRVPKIIE
jgi:aspartyl-tRNA(Asn)/glutamyl-tRNA(Gln) amidotransferase subunit C